MTSSVLSLVLGLLTLVATVSSAVAVAKASLAKSTIDTLKENNDALRENAEIQADALTKCAARLSVLEDENRLLRTLASGKDAVERMGVVLAEADGHRKDEHHDILASIQAQQAVFAGSHEEMLAVIRASVHTHAAGT